MRLVSLAAAVAVLAATLWAGASSVGPLPPLGPLLDPANGVWRLAVPASAPSDITVRIPELRDSVSVVYDDRNVPHVWATSREDAWRALGYVVARDRLFQLELQARAGAGTLTELVGEAALPADKRTRALGMPRAAELRWAAMPEASLGHRASVAFAEGVNAWIAGLRARDLPVEYHLLGREPSRWEPVNTMHLFNRMSYTLSYMPGELDLVTAAALVGEEAAAALYPVNAPVEEPIQPSARKMPSVTQLRLPPPGVPSARAVGMAAAAREFTPDDFQLASRGDAVLGSNNWAVAPSRSATGNALLAGDPHLELTLPSIWYEVHMVVPDTLDAYGVTIPGAPAVIIGFNRDVSWTFTNTGADVVDFWYETVDDTLSPRRYLLDGEWRDLELREETYVDQRGSVLATDTVRYTHRGPMRGEGNGWLSMRWTALDTSDAATPFLSGAMARSVDDFLTLTRDIIAPAQNMLVADRSGAIAIRSTGRYPIRAGDGRGNVIRDGSRSSEDWQGWWSPDEYPQSVAPPQGFLASANQDPFAADDAPRYLGFDWPTPWRAMRINELLRANAAVTVQDMAAWQTDPGSARADMFVPALVSAAQGIAPDDTASLAAARLAAWNRQYVAQDTTAVLFEAVMDALERLTWDELRPEDGPRAQLPTSTITAMLLMEPDSEWWDIRATSEVETRDSVLVRALRSGWAYAVRSHGEPSASRWRWSNIRHANIRHLLGFTPYSRLGIPVQGGPGLLNPSSGSGVHGASWRMVVEMGPEVRGWGVYPGGQSGNPADASYDDRLTAWREGRLDSLRFPASAGELSENSRRGALRLVPR